MTAAEMKAHALRFSQTYKRGYGLWADKETFNSMAKKTVLKLLLSKYAPLSVEMQSALKADQAVLKSEENVEYVDSEPDVQPQPEVTTESAQAKAAEVQAQVEAMKQRRASKPAEEDLPSADNETGEIFNGEK